ncbi:MAG: geranylgeranylglyceryl/heptaprenylglyceryl phosphate synthase [Candidatus Aenigmatarchaeota archaeon]
MAFRKSKKFEVLKYIQKRRRKGALHFLLIDPDKQTAKKAVELARMAKNAGTDAVMVGGSHAAQLIYLEETVSRIKEEVKLPIILFPSTHSALSPNADALFFMSLLNSRSPQYLIEEQMRGAVLVKNYGLEPLPMAYLIIESGAITSAAWAGDVRPIPRDKPDFAVGYALAAKFFGMKFVYLEAGSGAKMPVPNEMISTVKKAVGNDMFVIVGGGIRDAQTAREKVKAGADIIVTGTVAETSPQRLKDIIQAIHKPGKVEKGLEKVWKLGKYKI